MATATLRGLTRLRTSSSFLTHPTIRPQFGSKHAAIVVGSLQHRPLTFGATISAAITYTDHALSFLHTAMGTPWYITIPIFALGFSCIKTPIVLYNLERNRKARKLLPLLSATLLSTEKDALYKLIPRPKLFLSRITKPSQKQRRLIARKEFERAWGIQPWKVFASNLLPFPFWLLGIEAIRKHCGGPGGILSAFAGGLKPEEADTAGIHVQDAVVQGLDSTMTTGGCLWFTDLTAADPYCILPMALSAVLLFKAKPWSPSNQALLFGVEEKSTARPALKGIARAQLLFCIVIGPATIHLPAAMHLYWLTTSILADWHKAILGNIVDKRIYMEPRPEPTAQRQHLIMRPTREEYPVRKQ
ncbi:hypothetical protein QBC38DRAFT_475391 [Podospora fimiseda]|uniref:Mitochondrial inner membrane protein COX18 n=1 Tax=Podospora fimiseda TaxID=252190 RepID=A0AAN7BRS1_9PEZI|nr:hypothetical protein QBC38DRAFT_475391 [Podospora fimiseda]